MSNEGVPKFSRQDLKAIKDDLRYNLEEEGILESSHIKLLENIIDGFINQINTSDC